MLECVINVSEGRRPDLATELAAAGGRTVLDVHSDGHHNRTVLTLAGSDIEEASRAVAAAAVARLDLSNHDGVHPRIGVLDVVPFVPLDGSTMADPVAARNAFARWAGQELLLPCFVYGPERSLPEIRREAFKTLGPDAGPAQPHPTAGACAVGARPVLVAYNLWLAPGVPISVARSIAADLRSPAVRALGFDVGGQAQVSCNLIAPAAVGPGAVFDAVASRSEVARAELVGLVPASVLEAEPPSRWRALDLDPSRTIEARLQEAGLDGGRFG